LKDKLSDSFKNKEEEINYLKERMAHLHTADVNSLKFKHEDYVNSLNKENE